MDSGGIVGILRGLSPVFSPLRSDRLGNHTVAKVQNAGESDTNQGGLLTRGLRLTRARKCTRRRVVQRTEEA